MESVRHASHFMGSFHTLESVSVSVYAFIGSLGEEGNNNNTFISNITLYAVYIYMHCKTFIYNAHLNHS